MAPRQPPESPHDDRRSEPLRAADRSLIETSPVDEAAEDQPLTEIQVDPPQLESADETHINNDRIEAYLKGPTAFTA